MLVASPPALSVYDARSTLDLVRVGGCSLELLVRSGFVARLVAGVALRGDGREYGCISIVCVFEIEIARLYRSR